MMFYAQSPRARAWQEFKKGRFATIVLDDAWIDPLSEQVASSFAATTFYSVTIAERHLCLLHLDAAAESNAVFPFSKKPLE